ncbi:unnamed protein product, partial [marine sediment metagenome]
RTTPDRVGGKFLGKLKKEEEISYGQAKSEI